MKERNSGRMKRFPAFAAAVLLSAAIPGAGSAQMDVHLSTSKSGGGRIPIVVGDIEIARGDLRAAANYFSRVLKQDLEFTSIFVPLEFPTGADTLPGGGTAAAIVEGAMSWDGERYSLDATLFDFVSREMIFGKRYRFEHSALRTVAHELSDEILFFLVGETGIARTRLLFTRREGDVKNLHIIDYDGYGEKRMTSGELVVSPLWIDDHRFVFTSYRRDNPDLYLIDLTRGYRELISHRKGINMAGDYNPVSGELVVTLSIRGNSEIYLMGLDGTLGRRLTSNRAIDVSPVWSPNGREIAFVSDRSRTPQLYIMDRYGGNVRRLTVEGYYNTSPAWSPAGDLIAYSSREGGLYRLKLTSPDGMWLETVFDDLFSYEDACWAPDGRHIAAVVRYAGESWIVVVDIDSGTRRRLVKGETPSWSPLRSQ
jgi:TolB protein